MAIAAHLSDVTHPASSGPDAQICLTDRGNQDTPEWDAHELQVRSGYRLRRPAEVTQWSASLGGGRDWGWDPAYLQDHRYVSVISSDHPDHYRMTD